MTLPIGNRQVIAAVTAPGSGSPYATLASCIGGSMAAVYGYKIIAIDIVGAADINVNDTNGGDGTLTVTAGTVKQFAGVSIENQIRIRSTSASTVACTAVLHCRNDDAK